MKNMKSFTKVLTVFLAAILIINAVPVTFINAEQLVPSDDEYEARIIAFNPLPKEVETQVVPVGTDMFELNLPDTLLATVTLTSSSGLYSNDADVELTSPAAIETSETGIPEEDAEVYFEVPTQWSSYPQFDSTMPGTYIFTPTIDAYLIETSLPNITVIVGSLNIMMSAQTNEFLAPINPPDPSAIPIYTAEDLDSIRNNLSGTYVLKNDIDLSNFNNGEWIPIGNALESFTGVFDGQGYSIMNLKISDSSHEYNGLFGYVNYSEIKNVALVETSIDVVSSDYNAKFVGGICGHIYNGLISNCIVTGFIQGECYVGGICGLSNGADVSYCYNTADVSLKCSAIMDEPIGAGGIVGRNQNNCDISFCYNSGKISASASSNFGSSYHGGICIGGISGRGGNVFNSYNAGNISVDSLSQDHSTGGGIIGYSGSAFNCFNIGSVIIKGYNAYAGGIMGYSHYAISISSCYNTGNVNAIATRIYDGGYIWQIMPFSFAGGIIGRIAEDISGRQIISNVVLNQNVQVSADQDHYVRDLVGYWGYDYLKPNFVLDKILHGYDEGNEFTYISPPESQVQGFYENIGWLFGADWEMREGYAYPQLCSLPSAGSSPDDLISENDPDYYFFGTVAPETIHVANGILKENSIVLNITLNNYRTSETFPEHTQDELDALIIKNMRLNVKLPNGVSFADDALLGLSEVEIPCGNLALGEIKELNYQLMLDGNIIKDISNFPISAFVISDNAIRKEFYEIVSVTTEEDTTAVSPTDTANRWIKSDRDTLSWLNNSSNFMSTHYLANNDSNALSLLTQIAVSPFYNGLSYSEMLDYYGAETAIDDAEKVLLGFLEELELEIVDTAEDNINEKLLSAYSEGLDLYLEDVLKPTIDPNIYEGFRNTLNDMRESKNMRKAMKAWGFDGIKSNLLSASSSPTEKAQVERFLQQFETSSYLKTAFKVQGIFSKAQAAYDIFDYSAKKMADVAIIMEADELYIEMLDYLAENCIYSVVSEAAENLARRARQTYEQNCTEVLHELSLYGMGQITDALIDEVLLKFIDESTPMRILKLGADAGVTFSNLMFHTSDILNLQDSMRSLVYTGYALSKWSMERAIEFKLSTDETTRSANATRMIYAYNMLWKCRSLSENTVYNICQLLDMPWTDVSAGISECLKTTNKLKAIEYTLFKTDSDYLKDSEYTITAIAQCPVDVQIIDGDSIVKTISDGAILEEYGEDGVFITYLDEATEDYVKLAVVKTDGTRTIRLRGSDNGTVSFSLRGSTEAEDSVVYAVSHIPVKAGTIIDIGTKVDSTPSLEITNGVTSDLYQFQKGDTSFVSVESLSINKSNIVLKTGENYLLLSSTIPSNATEQGIKWSSSNPDVASVDKGMVTANSTGNTVITALSTDGNKIVTCSVLVEDTDASVINISASAGIGGTVNGSGTYATGDTVVLTATANEGYAFNGWFENNVKIPNAESIYSFIVTEDRVLEARFTPTTSDIFVITATAGKGGQVTGGGKYNANQSVNLIATPSSNYVFDGWYENGVKIIGANRIYSFIATYGRTLEARFIYNGSSDNDDDHSDNDRGDNRSDSSSANRNASISITKVDFDKANSKDIIITFSAGSYILRGLKNGAKDLTKDTEYSISGNTLTIYSSYLSTFNLGTQTLVIDMSGGSDPTITITIIDSSQANEPMPSAEPTPEPTSTPRPTPVVAPTPSPISYVNPFGDVSEEDWFYDDVAYVYQRGLMTGTSVTPMLFSPNMNFTRGMVVTALYRMAGSPVSYGLQNTFTDVEEGMWYTDAVKWAVVNEIIFGYGDGRFGTTDYITRQDLAVIFMRYADLTRASLPITREYVQFYDDAGIANYAKEAIDRFFRANIINGKLENAFDPDGNATRAEVSAMLHRFLQSMGK